MLRNARTSLNTGGTMPSNANRATVVHAALSSAELTVNSNVFFGVTTRNFAATTISPCKSHKRENECERQ